MSEFTDDQLRRFGAVYAEAVLTYLDSGEAQWLLWDPEADIFDFASIELDQPSLPILLFVDESWTHLCEVDAVTDPQSPQFDADRLRTAVETLIAEEGLGERILKKYLEQRAEAEAAAEEDDSEPRPERDDD